VGTYHNAQLRPGYPPVSELFEVTASAELTGHSYADDTQVYLSAPASSASISVQRFVACVERVDERMKNNRLRMNADRTQLVWLGTRQQLNKLTTTDLSLSSTRVKLSSSVLDFGVHIDSPAADHGRPRCRSTPVMSVPATSTANDQVITDLGISNNTGACIYQQ